jgi:hypothetical protein
MWPRGWFARTSAALIALAIPAAASAVQLDYQVGLGIEHDDNVNLSNDDPISDDILIPTLGFSVSQLGSTVQAAATGAVDYRDYLGGTFSDEFRGELNGRLNWTVLPERLDFTVQDRLALEPVNALVPDAPNNLQQTNVFAFGPTLSFRLADTIRGQAELFYIDSRAEDSDEFNSQRLHGGVRAIKDLDPTSTISLNLGDERTTFDSSSATPDYNRYGVFGRYTRKWSELDLIGDAGYSWLKYSGAGDFDRDSPLVRGDLVWRFAPHDTLTLNASYEFSDAATDLLSTTTTTPVDGTGGTPKIPADVALGNTTISSAPYLAKTISLGYLYHAERIELTVAPYWRKYDYGAVTFAEAGAIDQTSRGGILGAGYRITPLLTAGANAALEDLTYDTISRTDHNRYYTLYLRHQWARHWSWRAELARNERHSTDAGISSDENIVFFGFTYTR